MYNELDELPDAIRLRMPTTAQHIYQVAFNGAWSEYSNTRDREGGSREETAHKVAWAAVNHKYKKIIDNGWVQK